MIPELLSYIPTQVILIAFCLSFGLTSAMYGLLLLTTGLIGKTIRSQNNSWILGGLLLWVMAGACTYGLNKLWTYREAALHQVFWSVPIALLGVFLSTWIASSLIDRFVRSRVGHIYPQ